MLPEVSEPYILLVYARNWPWYSEASNLCLEVPMTQFLSTFAIGIALLTGSPFSGGETPRMGPFPLGIPRSSASPCRLGRGALRIGSDKKG